MRLLIHDYGGYGFIAELSRQLARSGCDVMHVFSGAVQTPQGTLRCVPTDPPSLNFMSINQSMIDKHSFVRRLRQERYHLAELLKSIKRYQPQVVISANTPSVIQAGLVRYCRANDIRVVTWVQDLYGTAAHTILKRRLPLVGGVIGRYFIRLDRRSIRDSDDVIVITDAFSNVMKDWRDAGTTWRVIPNWAPLEQIPVLSKCNAWAERQGLSDKRCIVYSGTLAMKHNPELLLALAERFRGETDVRVVVISEGIAIKWLRQAAENSRLDNLITLPFQAYEEVPEVLATADVLLAVLEPDASRFSVPSKVATYLCAGRPVLLAVPADNLAAITVEKIEAGYVVSPNDSNALCDRAVQLLCDSRLRERMGKMARAYAEDHFDLKKIGKQFVEVIEAVSQKTQSVI